MGLHAAPRFGAAAVAVVLGVSACSGGPRMPASARHPLSGSPAPEFAEQTTAAEAVGVPGDDETRATVIDFWASWCAACRETMPALDALFRQHREEGLVVIGVSEDDDEPTARRAARAFGASFPIVYDRGQDLAASYRVGSLPLTFVIDRAGLVRWVGHDPALAVRAALALLGPRP